MRHRANGWPVREGGFDFASDLRVSSDVEPTI
jgi:hypothetical protein